MQSRDATEEGNVLAYLIIGVIINKYHPHQDVKYSKNKQPSRLQKKNTVHQ